VRQPGLTASFEPPIYRLDIQHFPFTQHVLSPARGECGQLPGFVYSSNLPRRLISPLNSSLFSTTRRRNGVYGSAWLETVLTCRRSRDNGEGASDGRVDIRRNLEAVQ
jgi:hypothetical protein